jgi:hypothetical protein
MPMPAMDATASEQTRRAARQATARHLLEVCATVDAVTAEASAAVGLDDDRLFALLETREQMLQDLSEQLVTLQQLRPAADNALFAATERAVDEADQLIASVCDALATSQRATMVLAAKVSSRIDALRDELAAVQRSSSAGSAYQVGAAPHAVDLRR